MSFQKTIPKVCQKCSNLIWINEYKFPQNPTKITSEMFEK